MMERQIFSKVFRGFLITVLSLAIGVLVMAVLVLGTLFKNANERNTAFAKQAAEAAMASNEASRANNSLLEEARRRTETREAIIDDAIARLTTANQLSNNCLFLRDRGIRPKECVEVNAKVDTIIRGNQTQQTQSTQKPTGNTQRNTTTTGPQRPSTSTPRPNTPSTTAPPPQPPPPTPPPRCLLELFGVCFGG